MHKLLPLFLYLLLFTLTTEAQKNEKIPSSDLTTTIGIPWMENKGQFGEEILFHSKIISGDVVINRSNHLNYSIIAESGSHVNLSESFISNFHSFPEGKGISSTKVNYYKGKNGNHATDISSYTSISIQEVWPGISVELKSDRKNIEKVFRVNPGHDPTDIQLKIDGISDICINENQELQIDIGEESVAFSRPFAWQDIEKERIDIPVSYEIYPQGESFLYGFKLNQFDPAYPVIIDPILSSSFLGGADIDYAHKLKIANNGKVYVCGTTKSMNFPVTTGAYDESFNDTNSDYDLFVARFSSDLSMLEVCTYIGGNDEDNVHAIDIDDNGNVFITGETLSHDFPTTAGAFDQTHDGTKDFYDNIFITKFNTELNQLVASTFIGTEWGSSATCMEINNQNHVIIAGESAGELPQVGPQFQDPCEGVFVIKINNNLSTILASNSIDGSITYTYDMGIGPNGNIFVTGLTRDINNKLPVTPGCYDNTYDAGDDIFILKLDQSLANNLGCTYLGGNNDDEPRVIEFDAFGNVIIGGKSISSDYPTTPGVYDETWDNTEFRDDGIISILSNNLTELLKSTYLGAHNSGDGVYDIQLDENGNLLILGESGTGFPVSCNSILNGGSGVYLAKIDQQLENLAASTYLNGWRGSDPGSFELDQDGNIVVCGSTSSDDFPVLNGYDHSFNSDEYYHSDAFISRLTPDLIHGLPCCTSINYPEEGSWGILPFFSIDWNEAKDADGYYVSIGTEDDIHSILDQMDVGNQLTYDVSDLPCGETILITIDAYNENGIANGTDCISTSFHIIPPTLEVFHDTICEGDILYWEGFPLYYEGRFRVIHENQYGCDSTLQMNLKVLKSFFESTELTICEGENFEWFGQEYSEAGSYYQNFINEYGCDSIYELILQVIPGYIVNQSYSICEGENLNWENQVLTETGNYSVSYESQEGCDSTINLFLEVNPVYEFFESNEMCEGDSLFWEGQIIKNSGMFHANYTSIDNCDSIYHLEMTISPAFEFYDDYMICDGEELEWQGNIYSSQGIYGAHYTSKNGCDSSYYLNLVVHSNYAFEETANLCPDEKLTWHDMELVSPGEYQANYASEFGCDSSYYLTLAQTHIDTTISISGDQLNAVYDGAATYQWVKCPDLNPIPGATGASFDADESGTYAVLIMKDDCVDTSGCHTLLHSSIDNPGIYTFNVYPNPVLKGFLQISTTHMDEYLIRLIDLNGKELIRSSFAEKEKILDVRHFPPGVYMLSIESETNLKLSKIIIQN